MKKVIAILAVACIGATAPPLPPGMVAPVKPTHKVVVKAESPKGAAESKSMAKTAVSKSSVVIIPPGTHSAAWSNAVANGTYVISTNRVPEVKTNVWTLVDDFVGWNAYDFFQHYVGFSSSTNLRDWTPLYSFPYPTTSLHVEFTFTNTAPVMFFRAWAQ